MKRMKPLLGLAVLAAYVGNLSAEPFITSISVGSQSPTSTNPGNTASYAVTISKNNRGNRTVFLSVSGLPEGATAALAPAQVVFTGHESVPKTSTLTISTGTGLAQGNYPFVVTARDERDRFAFTADGILKVGPGQTTQALMPIILSISLVSPQTPQLVVSGSANQAYVLEATTDLGAPAWTPITTNMTGADGLFSYTDSAAPNYSTRFYRATLPY